MNPMGEVRRSVLGFVQRYPAAHAREVERQLGLSSRLASYHLESLVEEGRLRRIEEKGYLRYVTAETARALSDRDVAFLCVARRPPALKILLLLLSAAELPQGAITEALGLAKASTSYHLGALRDAGIALARTEGRNRYYRLADPEHARRMLAHYVPLPGQLDEFSRMWDDLFR